MSLKRRLATASVAIPTLLLALFWGSPAVGVTLVAGAVLWGMREFCALLEAAGLRPFRWTGFLVVSVTFMEVASPRGAALWPAAILVLLTAVLSRGSDLTGAVAGASGTLLGALYLGGLGGTIAALRVLSPIEAGAWRLVLLLAIVMSSDTAAFFVGHAFGRRPLAPALSPAKTVEGALGGLVGGALAALVVSKLGVVTLPLGHALALGVLVAALGMVGDLFESLLKRWAGRKDSGALFPGHGGMLDRLDSLLFGAPILYYYFVFVQ
jgi:phosphatidate cytidylyltransferase